MNSYWIDSTKQTNFKTLDNNVQTEVCIIGGGITGVATAYLLSKNNIDVTILEADRIGMGVTANTTAKITSQHGLLYNYLVNSFGIETAKAYYNSNEEAISLIKSIIDSENINCDFCFEDSYVYTCDKNNNLKISDEVSSINSFGGNAEYVTSSPLPFEISSAVKFHNQAQFHPRKYLLSLLPILINNNNKIYE